MTDSQVEQIGVLRDGDKLEVVVQVAGVSYRPGRRSDLVQGYYQ